MSAGRDDDLPAGAEGGDGLPDARDGLTRAERVVLMTLAELVAERCGASVPMAMLIGRVVERLDLSPDEAQCIVGRLARRELRR